MRTVPSTSRLLAGLVIALLLAGLVPALGPSAGAQEPSSDLLGDLLVPTRDAAGNPRSGVDVAVELSQIISPAAGSTGAPSRVVLASSESFADALAASVALDDAPLLLTPPDALPTAVRDELTRIRPLEAVILGGANAVSPEVQAQVEALGLTTRRIAGATRVETAVEVARAFAPDADVAIIVRATDADGGNTSAAWADSVTAGALAAQTGSPILLTTGNALSEPTRAHLAAGSFEAVLIVGGTAAVSEQVQQQLLGGGFFVERIAGANRADTAVRLAEVRNVGPFGRAVIVEGDGDLGWQTGIAAAGHAAATGAAILPIPGSTIPPEIAAYLEQNRPTAFTCLVSAPVCQQVGGRVDGSGGAVEGVRYDPPPGSALRPNELIRVGLDDPERRYTGDITVSSPTAGCDPSRPTYLPEGAATFGIGVPPDETVGDQPLKPGPVAVQPEGGEPEEDTGAQVGSGGDPVDLDPNEDSPGDPHPTRCLIEVTFEQADGGTAVDRVGFDVVDLHPHIRVASFPQVEGRPITFADRSHGIIDAWRWSFGDGRTSTEQHPVHTYASRGCMDVSLAITSPYAHWHSGRLFQDAVQRLVPVDPADGDTHLEVLVIDRAADDARVGGAPVSATRGSTTITRTAGADGWADFGDLGEGVWRISSPDQPRNDFVQEVIAGHTLCPVLALGPVGDLLVVVLDSDGATPIPNATVTVVADDGSIEALGQTDANGRFPALDLLVGSYDVKATLGGETIGTATGSVAEDEETTVQITRPAPPAPAATPTPTP